MKQRMLQIFLVGSMVCSAMPAQAYLKEFIGGAMSWALNSARSSITDTINQKDQEITQELHGMGTFGRVLLAATAFAALEVAMTSITNERVGILDLIFGGISLLGFSTPFTGKEQAGRNFFVRQGWVADHTPVAAAAEDIKTAYQSVQNALNVFTPANPAATAGAPQANTTQAQGNTAQANAAPQAQSQAQAGLNPFQSFFKWALGL